MLVNIRLFSLWQIRQFSLTRVTVNMSSLFNNAFLTAVMRSFMVLLSVRGRLRTVCERRSTYAHTCCSDPIRLWSLARYKWESSGFFSGLCFFRMLLAHHNEERGKSLEVDKQGAEWFRVVCMHCAVFILRCCRLPFERKSLCGFSKLVYVVCVCCCCARSSGSRSNLNMVKHASWVT